MKKIVIALLLVALSAPQAAVSQELPKAPSAARKTNPWLSPFKDPFFYAGTGFHASSVIADVQHSQQCQRERTCFEVNPGADLYKTRMVEIAGVGVMDYGCSLMLSDHKHWRPICMAVPVVIGILHWRDATHIYRVARR